MIMTDSLDRLFKFPTVMLDQENEEHRKKLGLPGDEDAEVIIGEAEYPFYELIGISDRWLPNQKSFQNAKEGNFDACYVTFNNIGTLLVPWTKSKFKKKFKEFVDSLKIAPQERNITFYLTEDPSKEVKIEGEESK